MTSGDIDAPLVLNNGVTVPRMALGVFRSGAGAGTRDAVSAALSAGYRHIDTAQIYRNEAEVGASVRASGIPRAEIFVTTKLWNEDHGYDQTLRACTRSLAALKLDHIDLYLVHWPAEGKRRETWRAMETLLGDGRCRAIGVSNFMPRHLDELLEHAVTPPAVNQFEIHPFLQQRDVVERCRAANIGVAAYSPLTKGLHLADPQLVEIAGRVGRHPAQVLLRWSLQKGYVVVPKSATPARIAENLTAFSFELDESTMQALDALDSGRRTAWDPTKVP
jgi:diketogulonate reductase-like aldo/keto reductase